jgi:hypothetical protein
MPYGELFPFAGGADQAVSDEAEPEVDQEADIDFKGPVARQGQGRGEQEVGHIAQDDGGEGLDEIEQHRRVRHQNGWFSFL